MKSSPNCRAAIGRVDQVAKVVVVLAALTALFVGASGQPPRLWAQSGPAHPDEPKSRVLTYVPTQKGKEARIVFVPPLRNFKREQNFRLQTPHGEVRVHCEMPRPFPSPKPSRGSNYEIQPVLEENIYYFRSPSPPIYLSPPYEGYAGGALYEVCLNGTTVRGGNHNGNPDNSIAPHEDVSPIVLRGKRNKLSLIMSNTDNE